MALGWDPSAWVFIAVHSVYLWYIGFFFFFLSCKYDQEGEEPLEEGMAAHSSIHARRIPWIEEAGRLWSIGSRD